MKAQALLLVIGDIGDCVMWSTLLSSKSSWKFKSDGDSFIHYAVFDPVDDGRKKTQDLVQSYIIAFKVKAVEHRSYTKQGSCIDKAIQNIQRNAYPLACNVISGLDQKSRMKGVYCYPNQKVTSLSRCYSKRAALMQNNHILCSP
jgi:hypothetical protein